MKRRIGILTSGGDCPGLNAAIRGVAKAAYELFETEIIGFYDGYKGLIEGEYRAMEQHEFSGILTLGGTILGTSRQPYKLMRVVTDDNVDKVGEMKKNYAQAEARLPRDAGRQRHAQDGAAALLRGPERRGPAQDDRQRHLGHGRDVRLPHGRGHRHGCRGPHPHDGARRTAA